MATNEQRTGAQVMAAYRTGRREFQRVNLSRADLRNEDLNGINFYGATLAGANLTGADLSRANLQYVMLAGALLTDVDLSHANLEWANLRGARLQETDLTQANLSSAVLRDADLYRANWAGANVLRADLHGADLTWSDIRQADLDPIKEMVLIAGGYCGYMIPDFIEALTAGTVDMDDLAVVQRFHTLVTFPGPTVEWFGAIGKGDTPENSQVAELTVDWLRQAVR